MRSHVPFGRVTSKPYESHRSYLPGTVVLLHEKTREERKRRRRSHAGLGRRRRGSRGQLITVERGCNASLSTTPKTRNYSRPSPARKLEVAGWKLEYAFCA